MAKTPKQWRSNIQRWSYKLINAAERAIRETSEEVIPIVERQVPVSALPEGMGRHGGDGATYEHRKLSKHVVRTKTKRSIAKGVSGGVRIAAGHSNLIEYGTNKIPPRPILRRSMESKRPELKDRMLEYGKGLAMSEGAAS